MPSCSYSHANIASIPCTPDALRAWTGLFCGQRNNLIFICPALTLCAIAPGVVKHINENEFDIRGISTSFIQTGLLNLWVIQDDNDITFDDWMKKLDIQVPQDIIVCSRVITN